MIDEKAFKKYKKETIQIANHLCYGQSVIQALKRAETEEQIAQIMRFARLK